MDKDKSHHGSGSLLPPSGRFSASSPPNNSYNLIPNQSGAFNFPPLGTGSSSEQGHFGHVMPSDNSPPENIGGFDGPSFSDWNEEDLLSMYLDMDDFNSDSATSGNQVGGESSSLLAAEPGSSSAYYPYSLANQVADNMGGALCENPRIMHQHTQSMEGLTTIKPGKLMSDAKKAKAKSAARLAEPALIDPKRAKRIRANRESALRSRERKMVYINELEKKVQTLQTEASSLSAELLQQRDTNALASENSKLKLRLQFMEQRVHLQEGLIYALNEEIQRLKVGTGQTTADSGAMMASYGSNKQQYHGDNQTMQAPLTNHQLHQLQQQSGNVNLSISMPPSMQKEDHGPNASSNDQN